MAVNAPHPPHTGVTDDAGLAEGRSWPAPPRRRLSTAAIVIGLHVLLLVLLHLGRSSTALTAAPQAMEVRVLDAPNPPPAVPTPAPPAPALALPRAVELPVPVVEVAVVAPPITTLLSPRPTTTGPATPAQSSTSSTAVPAAPERRGDAPPNDLPVTPPQAEAAHLNNPAPPYPPVSRRMGEQGQVWLDVFVQRDGSVGDVRLHRSSGYPLLDQAALTTVRQWRYVPAQRGGQTLAVWYQQQINFVLNP